VPETARLADQLGYDLLAVQDHPYRPTHLDALPLLGVILAQTDHVRVFPDGGNLPLRPPAALVNGRRHSACSAAGGSNSGWAPVAFWTPPRRRVRRLGHPGQSLEALEEAIVILRAWWSTPRVLGFHFAATSSKARVRDRSRRTRSGSGSVPPSHAR
jgi:alkanesulfonate monooxygenase SsuD/methylene tetrahydromethanopterin reductase-like flavin-dependent oxidoreductase (luciferase family)